VVVCSEGSFTVVEGLSVVCSTATQNLQLQLETDL